MNRKFICFPLILVILFPFFLEAKPKKNNPFEPLLKNEAYRNNSICIRGCQFWGFFAEFLWVINHLQWCDTQNKIPVVYWDDYFAYHSKDGYNGSMNGWEYYFEPIGSDKYNITPEDLIYRLGIYDNFSCFWSYNQYTKNIHLLSREEKKSILSVPLPKVFREDIQLPTDYGHPYGENLRHYVKSIIDKYIKIKPSIQHKIDTFYDSNMKGNHVVGIHLRGSFIWNEVGYVPIEYICNEANKVANENTIFLVATDQNPLLEAAKKLLKGKVIAYDSYRQDTTTSPTASSQWPPEMGEDVLVDAMLLSKCDYFIHTISSVSTAVLYFNPDLPHTMLYCAGAK